MSEITTITAILSQLGYTLASEQPHISGERFLMQAMTTVAGQKFILLGHNEAGEAVVIKATADAAGRQEITHERICRGQINQLDFAYDVFAVPEELLHTEVDGYLINIQRFIPQDCAFLERPIKAQFDYALRAFTAQEHSRATTGRHVAHIRKIFGLMETTDYLRTFGDFVTANIEDPKVQPTLSAAAKKLTSNQTAITQYGSFLTHTDFVPHNFRISNDKLYLLDFSAIRFGNKHESWARFLNFMTLYHPALEAAFLTYFKDNRAPEEYESLHLMRLFRLGEIITYYRRAAARSDGNLKDLNQARITFWHAVLEAELQHERVNDAVRAAYTTTRDNLRSEDEKKRQQGLH